MLCEWQTAFGLRLRGRIRGTAFCDRSLCIPLCTLCFVLFERLLLHPQEFAEAQTRHKCNIFVGRLLTKCCHFWTILHHNINKNASKPHQKRIKSASNTHHSFFHNIDAKCGTLGAHIGCIRGSRGFTCGSLGCTWGSLWAPLGALGAHLVALGAHFGCTSAHLGLTWVHLGLTWGILVLGCCMCVERCLSLSIYI